MSILVILLLIMISLILFKFLSVSISVWLIILGDFCVLIYWIISIFLLGSLSQIAVSDNINFILFGENVLNIFIFIFIFVYLFVYCMFNQFFLLFIELKMLYLYWNVKLSN